MSSIPYNTDNAKTNKTSNITAEPGSSMIIEATEGSMVQKFPWAIVALFGLVALGGLIIVGRRH